MPPWDAPVHTQTGKHGAVRPHPRGLHGHVSTATPPALYVSHFLIKHRAGSYFNDQIWGKSLRMDYCPGAQERKPIPIIFVYFSQN